MPELPEVETIKLVLQRKIVDKTIKDIEVLSPKAFIGDPKEIRGQKVLKIERFAKLLAIDVIPSDSEGSLTNVSSNKLRDSSPSAQNDNGVTLLIHLKMTGQLIWESQRVRESKSQRFIGGHPTEDMMGKMPNAHTRVIFTFSDGSKLYFNDQRRFGWIKILNLKSSIINQLGHLGPEPFDKNFTWQILKSNLLNHKSQPVKVALMDQSVVSGVGNIYSNEACFAAGLDPRRKVGDMEDKEFKALCQGVIRVIKEGIRHGGSTRAHFRDPEGHKGYFLDYAFVYGLDKHPCKVCQTEIKKIQLGGRGTYYCPKCQKWLDR